MSNKQRPQANSHPKQPTLVGDVRQLDGGFRPWTTPEWGNHALDCFIHHAGLDPWWDERSALDQAWDAVINVEVLALIRAHGWPDDNAELALSDAVIVIRDGENKLQSLDGHIDLARQHVNDYLNGWHDGYVVSGEWRAATATPFNPEFDRLLRGLEQP